MPIYTRPSIVSGRNLVINGDMSIDQNREGGVYTSSASEVYSLDQWRFAGAGATGVFTIQRTAATGFGFPFSLNTVVTTQQVVLAATDNFHLEYPIESPSIAQLAFGTANAKTVALSFWVNCTTIGTYSVALMEGTNTRSYVTTFVVNTASIWEYKTVIIPGDTGGTYQTADSTFGLKILWSWGVGSTYSTSTSETWQGSATWNKTGSSQLIQQAAGQAMFLTGVQLEANLVSTPFEYRAPSEQLALLQRFYYKTFPKGTAVAQAGGVGGTLTYITKLAAANGDGVQLRYPVQMCGSPTVTTYNPSTASATWRNISNNSTSGAPTIFLASQDGAFIYNPQVAGDNLGALEAIHVTANARLGGG